MPITQGQVAAAKAIQDAAVTPNFVIADSTEDDSALPDFAGDLGLKEQVTSVEGLYRLSLNHAKQFDAHDLQIAAEDLELTLHQGSVFVADTDQGATGLVLLGSGHIRFHPQPETEKGQVKIFCGKETLESPFDAAFVRINPGDFDSRFAMTSDSA